MSEAPRQQGEGGALPPGRKGRRRAWWAGGIALLALIVAVVAVAAALAPVNEEPEGMAWSGGEAFTDKAAGYGQDADTRGSKLSAAEESRSAGAAPAQTQSGSELPELKPKVIKTGKVSLELEKGLFQEKRGEVYFLVESAGGYVQSESTGESDGAARGTFLLRVPADRFDQVFPELAALGKASSMEVATQDVTQEYVDLEGRIRHMEAEEQFYLDLIAQAKTIQEMISIRERLDSVQLQKEQALGRKNYLDKQISYSLITLNMAERSPDSPAGKGFWGRVGEAFKSFGRACRELLVGLAYALPYLAVLLVLVLIIWAVVKNKRGKAGRGGPGAGELPPQASP